MVAAQPFLRPTATQEIRTFLDAEGLRISPSAGLTEVLAELFDLFARRRDDRRFWGPLEDLLGRLVQARDGDGEGLPTPAAEILRDAEIDAIITQLRESLPTSGGGTRAALGAILSKLGAPAVCCVLLLSLAAGCDKAPASSPTAVPPVAVTAPAPPAEPEPAPAVAVTTKKEVKAPTEEPPKATPEPAPEPKAAAGATEPVEAAPAPEPPAPKVVEKPPPPSVFELLESSDLKRRDKATLRRCLKRAYEQQEREVLVELFASSTPEEIAEKLEELADSRTCRKYQRKKRKVVPVALYKGVSFPTD